MLAGCVVVPRTTEAYDSDCRIVSRKMVLEGVQVGSIQSCSNDGCIGLLVTAGVIAAGSAVISGSIALVGNAIYWLEKQGNCRSTGAQLPK